MASLLVFSSYHIVLILVPTLPTGACKSNEQQEYSQHEHKSQVLFFFPNMGDQRVNLDSPRYDQSTYWGRATHFFLTTNPLNLFATPTALKQAKDVVDRYRQGQDVGLTEDELWKKKQLVDSAFHPDTGELVLMPGRIAFQVPGNMFITGMMMTFYKTTPQVVFWQWFNQTFNSYVNYSNRSGSTPIAKSTLVTSYLAATGGALTTAYVDLLLE